MADKFGPYIQKLMTIVLDKENDDFVKKLAWNELKRINIDVNDFLRKNIEDDEENSKNTIKQLLQEEKENG